MKQTMRRMLTLGISVLTLSLLNLSVFAGERQSTSAEVIPKAQLEEQMQVTKGSGTGHKTSLPTETLLKEEALTQQSGSLTIQLTDGGTGTKKEGVGFSVIKIAEVKDGRYALLDGYQASGLNEVTSAAQLEQLANDLDAQTKKLDAAKQTTYSLKTDVNGQAVLKNLPVGVYLISAAQTADYDRITPSLLAIPSYDETQKELIYAVTVVPKHSPKPGSTPPSETTPPEEESRMVHQTGYDSPVIWYFLGAGGIALVLPGRLISKKKQRKAP